MTIQGKRAITWGWGVNLHFTLVLPFNLTRLDYVTGNVGDFCPFTGKFLINSPYHGHKSGNIALYGKGLMYKGRGLMINLHRQLNFDIHFFLSTDKEPVSNQLLQVEQKILPDEVCSSVLE